MFDGPLTDYDKSIQKAMRKQDKDFKKSLSLFDQLPPRKKKKLKKRKKSSKKKTSSWGRPAQNYHRVPVGIPPEFVILAIVALGVIALWVFVINPAIIWVQENWLFVSLAIVVVVILVGAALFLWFKRKQAIVAEMSEKGLVKYKNAEGKEVWGTSEEAKKATLLGQVIQRIEEFEPSQKYRNEFPYHTELQGWLKSAFLNSKIELRTGSTRPDIVIEDVAIEVKGPTGHTELKTVADKAMRYSKHFENLVVVLFEVTANKRLLEEWKEGMEKTFPNVKVIEK